MHPGVRDGLIGTTVEHYEIVARLGGGGMGVVYAARDTKLGRRVALKFLPPQWCQDHAARERFVREAQTASATDHRNICTIHDIETAADGQLFIVMAHYDGETLKQRLDRGPLPADEAIDIAAQVAEGLARAHAQGVVHRDIKPANLMLTEDGVRILDFGLAKFAETRARLTLEGSTIGTVAYMSPEQARGEEADARSDVWAIGAVLYEMLAGAPPFKGMYPEAIAHAIKTDPPAPLRAAGHNVSEALEQIVFRALHKSPAVRYQGARDLARALRQLQGRTVPLDLRTEPLPGMPAVAAAASPSARSTPWWKQRGPMAASIVAGLFLVGVPLWILTPIERRSIAVAPVVNQTGYMEIEPYRLALAHELGAALADSRVIRVLPYDRLIQIVRRFRQDGDVSSRAALQALATHAGVETIVAPTLLYEDGGWKARVEFRDAATATNDAIVETPAVVSSLMKDAAHGLMVSVAADVEAQFVRSGSWRARIGNSLRAFFDDDAAVAPRRLASLDAAEAFARGLDLYEEQEYSGALAAFTRASELDARSALPFAWRSRTAWLMRQDREAAAAAQQAAALLTPETPETVSTFVRAVAAEARRDGAAAEGAIQRLISQHPDEPAWRLELAALQDRLLKTTEAVETYHLALAADSRLVRPHLELCRLYGPARSNDPPAAREQGRLALEGYRALGARAGQAQALWCMTDVLRLGSADDRREARRSADEALAIVEALGYDYNLSRAQYYVALAARAQGNLPEATDLWERSLVTARRAGNAVLEPLLLMNLGVMSEGLGRRESAARYYEESHARYEALGDEARAAQNQANQAALQIQYGPDPDAGLRNMQNALAVVQKLGDKNFEVFCRQVIAHRYRDMGRYGEAEAEVNRALAIARERNLEDDVAHLTLDLAASRLALGDYARARQLLVNSGGDRSGQSSVEARLRLARTLTYLGDFSGAESALSMVADDIAAREQWLLPLLDTVAGELAYISGRASDARRHFERASSRWTDRLPDIASVEARAYLGLIDGTSGATERGVAMLDAVLAQARAMGQAGLEGRARLFLAEIALRQRRFADAVRIIQELPPDDSSRTVGIELRARLHDAARRAFAGLGDAQRATSEATQARELIERVRSSLPDADSARFVARPDIVAMMTGVRQ